MTERGSLACPHHISKTVIDIIKTILLKQQFVISTQVQLKSVMFIGEIVYLVAAVDVLY